MEMSQYTVTSQSIDAFSW